MRIVCLQQIVRYEGVILLSENNIVHNGKGCKESPILFATENISIFYVTTRDVVSGGYLYIVESSFQLARQLFTPKGYFAPHLASNLSSAKRAIYLVGAL